MKTVEHGELFEIGLRTDPGRDPDKQVNEDHAIVHEIKHGLLGLVCDGMGGHAGGREASHLAVSTIVEIVEAAPLVTSAALALRHAIEEANARVWSMVTSEIGYRPGSTVVAVLVHARGVDVAHVGDSRLYFVHGGTISQVTRDHSMVQEMVDRKIIRPEDAAKHPDANKIMRALGIAKTVDVDVRAEPLAYVPGDVLVLCSDGLSDLVEPSDILRIVGSVPPAQAAHDLVDLANERGGHDNITALVIRLMTAAERDAAPTVVRTVIDTPKLPEVAVGPRGTMVRSAVAPTVLTAPASAPSPPYPPAGVHAAPPPSAAPPLAHIPPAPTSSRRTAGGASVSPAVRVVVAVVMTLLLASAVLATALHLHRRSRHRTVPLVDASLPTAPLPSEPAAIEDDEPVIEPAPPLEPRPEASDASVSGAESP